MQHIAWPGNISVYCIGNLLHSLAFVCLANLILLPAQVVSAELWTWFQLVSYWCQVGSYTSRPKVGAWDQLQTFQITLVCQSVEVKTFHFI